MLEIRVGEQRMRRQCTIGPIYFWPAMERTQMTDRTSHNFCENFAVLLCRSAKCLGPAQAISGDFGVTRRARGLQIMSHSTASSVNTAFLNTDGRDKIHESRL
ncbi:uncharacterized protein LOC111269339 [Varroa jacobsoni]|uniref:uncharacterized protein LOC111269339 n=1 Tax=Varroa jacobsoni TaxID=62625 RepID=UPI000BF6868E|nr:uncharacterized protein LOC111269339 [Varroa jacobsoni]